MNLPTLSDFANTRLVFEVPLPLVALLLVLSIGASLLATYLFEKEFEKRVGRRLQNDFEAVGVRCHEVRFLGPSIEPTVVRTEAERRGDAELLRFVQVSQSRVNVRRSKSPTRVTLSDTTHPLLGALS